MALTLGILATPCAAQLSESSTRSSRDDREDSPMAWLGLGVKTGFSYIGSSELEIDYGSRVEEITTDSRMAFQVGLPIQIGGSGLGLALEPYFAVDSNIQAYGAYLGPTLHLHLAQPLYLGIGAGIKAAYLTARYLDYGLDVGGRIPLMLTAYVADDLALVFEGAFGYTASGYVYEDRLGGQLSEIEYGWAVAWDTSVGIRFP